MILLTFILLLYLGYLRTSAEPSPDAFPLHYRSPYIPGNRPYRFANDGTPIYGYQPRIDPNRALLPPPQSITSDVVVGAPIGRYYPDTDTWVPAPYVKDEYEDSSSEML